MTEDNTTTEGIGCGKKNFGAFPVTQSPADSRPRWLAVRQAIEGHRKGGSAPIRLFFDGNVK